MIGSAGHKAARALLLVALPLAGLAALWVQSDTLSRQGTDWEVPIQGYDPRDLLRGHYVEFRYDWPIREGGPENARTRALREPLYLCLIGEPPVIEEAVPYASPYDPGFEACEHSLRVQPGSVYGYSSLTRGRLYVGQDRAAALDEQLRDREQLGIVSFRQRDDGVLTPLDIRFRPLTEQELEERERTRAADVVIDQARETAEAQEPSPPAADQADTPETE
ncbi:MAG: GDYXXLXY domain-containing protein [Pseudomonadota bacterium]